MNIKVKPFAGVLAKGLFFLYVWFRVVCEVEDVVHRNIMELRQGDEDFGGDVALAEFVIAVNLLGTFKNMSLSFCVETPYIDTFCRWGYN